MIHDIMNVVVYGIFGAVSAQAIAAIIVSPFLPILAVGITLI